MIEFTKEVCGELDAALRREWLEIFIADWVAPFFRGVAHWIAHQ